MFVGYRVLPADDKASLSSAHYLHRYLPHFKFSLQILAVGVCDSQASSLKSNIIRRLIVSERLHWHTFVVVRRQIGTSKMTFPVSQVAISHYQNNLEIFLMPEKLLQLSCN